MTTKIEAKRKELESNIKMDDNLGNSINELCGFNLGVEMVKKKIDKIYRERIFVTGSMQSMEKEEQAYRKGWIDCYNKIKQSLGGGK